MEKRNSKQLAILATRARLLALDAVHTAASGHIGGSPGIGHGTVRVGDENVAVDHAHPTGIGDGAGLSRRELDDIFAFF